MVIWSVDHRDASGRRGSGGVSSGNGRNRFRALAAGGPTAVTRAISGRPARRIANRIIAEGRAVEADLPPYPVQNELTKEIRAAAAAQDRPEFLSLWAGQGVGLVRDGVKAGDLVARLAVETEAALLDALR